MCHDAVPGYGGHVLFVFDISLGEPWPDEDPSHRSDLPVRVRSPGLVGSGGRDLSLRPSARPCALRGLSSLALGAGRGASQWALEDLGAAWHRKPASQPVLGEAKRCVTSPPIMEVDGTLYRPCRPVFGPQRRGAETKPTAGVLFGP